MIARTNEGAWIVPPRLALWIPPHTPHSVEMRDEVEMRTVYVRAAESGSIGARCNVISVSPLLREAILALLDEPILYDERGRGGALAALVLDELRRAASASLELPLPTDMRLVALCDALIGDPSLPLDLDDWAERLGLSRRSLTRRFRAETGLSFGTWRRRLRALEASALLAGGASTGHIARSVGYRSASALRSLLRGA